MSFKLNLKHDTKIFSSWKGNKLQSSSLFLLLDGFLKHIFVDSASASCFLCHLLTAKIAFGLLSFSLFKIIEALKMYNRI